MTITDTASFLAECNSLGILLSAADGNVHCRAPRGKITEKIRTTITANKKEILAVLAAVGAGEQSALPPAAASIDGEHPAAGAAPAAQSPPPAAAAIRHRRHPPAPLPRSCEPWPADVDQAAAFTLLLTADDLDALGENLFLRPWEKIADRQKFLEEIKADIAAHAAGRPTNTGRIGDLQARLLALRGHLVGSHENDLSQRLKIAA